MAKTKNKKKVRDDYIYMTKEAYEDMLKEMDYREKVRRKEIAQALKEARTQGDLSENFDYAEAMEENQLNETRISELKILSKKVKIAKNNSSDDVVEVGEKVEIKNLDTNSKRVVELVGSEETQAADSLKGKLSTDSPLGSVLRGSSIGDTVEFKVGDRLVRYKVLRFVRSS